MRRLVCTVVAIAFGLATVVALTAHAAPICTIRGTPGRDFLPGTPHRDRICARGSGDYAAGFDARDRVRGGPGNDTLVGGTGHDRIIGLGGADKLFAIDGHGGDSLYGGSGNDACYGEKGDHYHNCGRVVTNHSPTYPRSAVLALSKALQQAIKLANHKLCRLHKTISVCVEGG